jgi:hypothetical protein
MTDMKAIQRVLVLLAPAIVLASTLPAAADEAEEYASQQAVRLYFDLPENARTFGMAGSSVATSQDVSGLFGNPAGLGWLPGVEIAVTLGFDKISGEEFLASDEPSSSDFDNVGQDFGGGHLQVGMPIEEGSGGVLGMGVSLIGSDVDDQYRTDTDGFRLHIGYGKRIDEDLTLGYALSYHRLDHVNDFVDCSLESAYRHTLGLEYRLDERWMLGVFGFYGRGDWDCDWQQPYLDVNVDADRQSLGANMGIFWQALERTGVAASVDYTDYETDADVGESMGYLGEDVNEEGYSLGARAGIEQEIKEWLDLRGGYRFQHIDYDFHDSGVATSLSGTNSYHAVTAGLGLSRLGETEIELAYGIEYRFIGDGDFTHVITLAFRF